MSADLIAHLIADTAATYGAWLTALGLIDLWRDLRYLV